MSGPSEDARPERLIPGATVAGRVDALHHDGFARAELADGREARVFGGVPGDAGTFTIAHAGKNAIWANVETLDPPSPHRVEPPCPIVAECGGCPWQMVDAPAQHAARDGFLREALAGVADAATFHPAVQTDPRVGYRTRALMILRHYKGTLRAGFYRPRSQELVPAEGCDVQDPRINAVITAAVAELDARRLSSWSHSGWGLLRALAARLDPRSGDVLLTIVASRDDAALDEVAPALLAIEGVSGVWVTIADAPSAPLLSGAVRHLTGARRQRLDFGVLDALAGPQSFVQTHHAMAEALLRVVALALPERVGHLVDLYAGIGVFGLALRDRAARVTLAEKSEDAVSDAQANVSRLADAEHVRVVAGDVGETVKLALTTPADADAAGLPTAVLLDPPRAGAAPEVIEAIGAAGPHVVVYVSCNPRTLGRDLARLAAHGYVATDVTPLEMFPHTPHQEVVVRLAAKAGRDASSAGGMTQTAQSS